MNAAETIAAAIENLEQRRAFATRDGWQMHGDDLFGYVYRTIDAQLMLLRRQQSRGRIASFNRVQVPDSDHGFWDAVELARAILGGVA